MTRKTKPISPQSSQTQQDLARPPRIAVEPIDYYQTDGDACADFCAHYWFEPDEWQRRLLRVWLARDENGHLLVISAGLSVPRQNGKNGAVECLELYLLVTQPGIKILHTAHSTKTAQKAFKRLETLFTGKVAGKKREAKTLMKLVDKANGGSIRYTNGEWAIYLSNGSSIEYCTRTNAGGRGFDGINLLIYDEAQELTDSHVEALGPVTDAAVGDSVIMYLGTPPNETASGEVFTRHRKAALNDPGPHESWHEWSIEKLPDPNSTFEDLIPLIQATNPSYELPRPGHLTEDRTRRNFADMSFEGFCRERLGYWSEQVITNPALDKSSWDDLANLEPTTTGKLKRTVGIKFSPDGEHVAVVNASKAIGEKPHVELIEYTNFSHAGTKPLAQALYKIRNEVSYVLIDGVGAASTLMDDLKALHYPDAGYGRANTADVVAAAESMVKWVRSGAFTHYDQEALNDSAYTSVKRNIGKGYGFGGAECEPIEAASLALLAMKRTKRTPHKTKRRVSVKR